MKGKIDIPFFATSYLKYFPYQKQVMFIDRGSVFSSVGNFLKLRCIEVVHCRYFNLYIENYSLNKDTIKLNRHNRINHSNGSEPNEKMLSGIGHVLAVAFAKLFNFF